MSKIVPLISSGTAGPLGVLHLPRLWQKASLDAAGKLADGYAAIGQGYDQMALDALGVSKDDFVAFIATKPSYLECEAWIKENGTSVTEEAITKFNAAVEGYIHTDETCEGIFKDIGASEGMPRDAVNLNNLDDWAAFHKSEIA